jgi:protein O-mannosyl-transferase
MAAKEVMVSAPLIVLLYDRTFVAGSLREAWRLRWRYYLGLACTWLLLGYLIIGTGRRGGTAGFGGSLPAWDYALTQFRAMAQYLRLSVWPQPLVFDYGRPVFHTVAEAAPYAAIVVPLLALTALGLWRNHALGFLGAWFFAILAPSSSVVPVVTETMAEHRMYLALAAVVAAIIFGLYTLFGRRGVIIGVALSVIFGVLTARRNEDYRSELAIWSDTVAKCPDNPWAYLSEGHALLLLGRLTEARDQFETALRIKPDLAEAYQDLGVILDQEGRIGEAINDYTQAISLAANLVDAHYNLAVDLNRMGRLAAAIDQYREVVRATPDDFMAQCGLGSALAQQGHLAEAHAQFEETVQIFPESAEARYNLGNILVQLGRLPEAAEQYELALQYKPNFTAARKNLELTRKTMAQPTAGSEK